MSKRKRRRREQQAQTIDQINVTPLLDLVFLLLIAFMITMPLMEYGTSVNPPEMKGKSLPKENFRSVSLTADNLIEYEKQTVSREELFARLQELKGQMPDAVVLLRCDGSRPYSDVIDLMRDIKNSGFTNITLVTQAERKR